ncbi:hypothetical protein ACHAWF_013561 [Thalassiosira exigua]
MRLVAAARARRLPPSAILGLLRRSDRRRLPSSGGSGGAGRGFGSSSSGASSRDVGDGDGEDEGGAGRCESKEAAYFHVSPSGDWWTGPSIFAAKHLQPDYVKSIPMPPGFDPALHFGDEEDYDDDDEKEEEDGEGNNGDRRAGGQGEIEGNGEASLSSRRTKKPSWEERQQTLHRIYDEGRFPPELLSESSESERLAEGSDGRTDGQKARGR